MDTHAVAPAPQRRGEAARDRWADIDAPSVDRFLRAGLVQLTQGISPASLALAWMDWAMHLAQSPGKWWWLAEKAWHKDMRWLAAAAPAPADGPGPMPVVPLPQDHRFREPAWQRWPYRWIYQGFLLNQQWWHKACTSVPGVSHHHEQMVAFAARQLLDMVSPVNFIATNPAVVEATTREGGMNLVRGAINLLQDRAREAASMPPVGCEHFQPGVAVAVTPGDVVYRNDLIELIQYAPAGPTVFAEPMLIVPAWIMKYYILDLSPHNSLVRYLVARGHTVFMISWHNPGAADRDLGMDDYVRRGVMAAIEAVRMIVPGEHINTVGYCLGGSLLAIAAALLACRSNDIINSMTLLAAQTDFSEAGELLLFIDESQLSWLEDLMWQQGFLDNRQMAGAFRLLRSNDLVWSLAVNQYLLGRRDAPTDLMAWNSDTTRMPFRMHSDYLRRLFLDNDLFSGRYRVAGEPVALSNISAPVFAVGTMTDHVSPWRSVYKIHLVGSSDVSFVLTSGGHNAGIVSEPGHRGRYYFSSFRAKGECYTDPDHWLAQAPRQEGSWWPHWATWLERNSDGGKTATPPRSVSLGAAPGRYVLER